MTSEKACHPSLLLLNPLLLNPLHQTQWSRSSIKGYYREFYECHSVFMKNKIVMKYATSPFDAF